METLNKKAMLCRVSISQFNPVRKDQKTTNEVLTEKNATREAGKWLKNLIDPKALDPITKAAQDARVKHYTLTLPWSDEGIRILPVNLYVRYMDQMRTARVCFENEVNNFITEWPEHVNRARVNLNGMFRPFDYPSQDALKYKFGFNVNFLPIPSGNDFRVSLHDGELEKIRTETDERIKEAEKEAMKNLFQRLADPIKHMAETLKDEKKIFRNTLVSNLTDILNLIPDLNLTGDENLKNLISECREKLTVYTPEELRDKKKIRTQAAINAEDILEKMKGYI